MATITISNIMGIVFDLDGTLLNSVDAHVYSWIRAFKEHGITQYTKDELYNLIGLPGQTIVEIIGGKKALEKYKSIRKKKDEAFKKFFKEGLVPLYPDVEDTLMILKDRGFKLGLSTSTPSYMLEEILAIHQIKKYFDVIVPGDEVEKGKPDPEIFTKAFQKLEIEPRYGAIVGDSEYDVIPAKRIGALSILVDYRNRGLNPTWREKPDIIISKLSDLIKIL